MNYADRVKDTSASVGTGPITLFGAPITGFRSFLSAFPSGAVDVPYAIDDGAGSWEIGIGSFADSVLTRTQVLSSSSNGGLVDFVAGKKSVICTLPADLVESATNRSIAAASESAGHAVQTAQDKAQTGLDRAATAADRLATAADKLQTGIDAEVASSAKSAAESAASSAAESASSAAEQAAAAAPVQSVFGRTGTVTLQSTDVTGALGFTPLDAAQKSAANGIAPLGSDSKVPAAYLPSYVDDVLEYANLAGFPAIGETAKIYVALDTNKTYRWSGSAYVEISPSPGTTDSLTEGATNLYFTTARARAALSATGAVSYNSATGVISAELTSGYASKTVATNTTLAADNEYETGRNLRINHGVNLAIPASTKLIVRKYAAGSSL